MKLHEECGIFACIVKDNNAFKYIKYGLMMLQHRGQESAGITAGNKSFETIKNTGLAAEVFKNISDIPGNFGIGHVRYSTCGLSDKEHAQPFQETVYNEHAAIAHNGNISKSLAVNSSDTKIILKKLIEDINKKPSDWTADDISSSLYKNFKDGAWSIVIALPERIIGIKDPSGYRPLMFCEADEGYFLASEDCAFNTLSINKIISIDAGEYIEITNKGYKIKKYQVTEKTNQCVFEHIYFANPASNIFNKNVYSARIELGKKLAQEDTINADITIPVMSSGLTCAIGYSEKSGIPLHLGLKRNKILLRSFIQPTKENREKTAKEKYIPIKSIINGKRIVLVDDSIVRGTTMKYLTKLLRENGAKEVHIRLSAPPLINSCLYGIDIPDKSELIYNQFGNEQELTKYLDADSLKYISMESFKEVFDSEKFCYKCFKLSEQKFTISQRCYKANT